MKKDLAHTFIVYGLGNGLSKIVPLILLPIFSNRFSTTDYGVLELINTIVLIVSIFGMLELSSSLQRYYYEYNDSEKPKLISSIFISVFLNSFLFAFIIFLFSEKISQSLFATTQYKTLIIASIPLLFLTNFNLLFAVLLRYLKRTKTFAIITALQTIFISLGSLLFVFYFDYSIYGMIYGQLLGFGVSSLLFFLFIRKHIQYKVSFSIIKKAFSFALPLFPARLSGVFFSNMNKFFIALILSLSDTGLYSIALKVAGGANILTTAFTLSWQPFLYENYKKENSKKVFNEVFSFVCLVIPFFSITFSLFSQDIMHILTPNPEYENAHYLLGILATSFLFSIPKTILDMGAQITKKTIYITYQFLTITVLSLAFLFPFMYFWGVKGAVLVDLLSAIFKVSIGFYLTKKLYPMNFKGSFLFYSLFAASSIAILSLFVRFPTSVKMIYAVLLCAVAVYLFKKIRSYSLHRH